MVRNATKSPGFSEDALENSRVVFVYYRNDEDDYKTIFSALRLFRPINYPARETDVGIEQRLIRFLLLTYFRHVERE